MPTTRTKVSVLFFAILLNLSSFSAAHHSFSIYDLEQHFLFEGVVETLNFRNPHMSMTLRVTNENGETEIINFSDGAPANMLARMGLRAEMIKPGTTLKASGSPRRENPKELFLTEVTLEDGKIFNAFTGASQVE